MRLNGQENKERKIEKDVETVYPSSSFSDIMYLKNLTHILKIRVSEEDYQFLIDKSEQLNISIASLLRLLISYYIKETNINADLQSYFNDKLQ